MKIYISNLDYGIESDELKALFKPYGEVKSAVIVKDAFTHVSKGFGYVQMDDEAARLAIRDLNQTVMHTLTITVMEAPKRPLQNRSVK